MGHGKAEFKPNQILTQKRTRGLSPCLINVIPVMQDALSPSNVGRRRSLSCGEELHQHRGRRIRAACLRKPQLQPLSDV